MLDQDVELDAGWSENDDCGCWVATMVIDGAEVEAHHWIPDDTAPHVPDTQCGCGPALRDDAKGVLLFEHHDQDDQAGADEPGADGSGVGAAGGGVDRVAPVDGDVRR